VSEFDKALGLLGLVALAFLLMVWVESKLGSVTLRVLALLTVIALFVLAAWEFLA
jgi:hypothetical protein